MRKWKEWEKFDGMVLLQSRRRDAVNDSVEQLEKTPGFSHSHRNGSPLLNYQKATVCTSFCQGNKKTDDLAERRCMDLEMDGAWKEERLGRGYNREEESAEDTHVT